MAELPFCGSQPCRRHVYYIFCFRDTTWENRDHSSDRRDTNYVKWRVMYFIISRARLTCLFTEFLPLTADYARCEEKILPGIVWTLFLLQIFMKTSASLLVVS
jgi:hypothetical protein